MNGPDPTQTILDAIRRIVQSLRQPAGTQRARLGPARLFVLRSLAATPDQSLGDLAARTRTEPSSVSVVITRLVADGYVTRAKAEDDARRSVLRLTPAGRALVRRQPAAPQERLVAALDALPKARRKQLATLLTTVVADMGLDAGAAPLFFEDPPKGKR